MTIGIEKARRGDAEAIGRLLEANALPLDGLREHLDTAVVARQGRHIIGIAALEVYRDGVLMRSVAVDPAMQSRGLGRRLTESVLKLAREMGAPHAYLLTTTAERYFPRFGFEPIERDDVPASVQASIEYRSACPASAVVMRKAL